MFQDGGDCLSMRFLVLANDYFLSMCVGEALLNNEGSIGGRVLGVWGGDVGDYLLTLFSWFCGFLFPFILGRLMAETLAWLGEECRGLCFIVPFIFCSGAELLDSTAVGENFATPV